MSDPTQDMEEAAHAVSHRHHMRPSGAVPGVGIGIGAFGSYGNGAVTGTGQDVCQPGQMNCGNDENNPIDSGTGGAPAGAAAPSGGMAS